MDSTHVIVGRQPIFDRDLLIVGYELLFRSARSLHSADPRTPGDEKTATVFASALSIGLDRLVGGKNIFCNADRGVLSGAVPLLLPPTRTVIEIAPDIVFDIEIEQGCRELREAGFRLALDDFIWSPGTEPFLPLVDFVKIDTSSTGASEALTVAERLRDRGVAALAHKVETEQDLNRCLAAGFALLQGYALARPTTISGATLEASILGALQLSAAALDPAADLDDVERTIRRDPALAVQLLEIASIGDLGGFRRTVRSIREALVLLGSQRLRSWVTLLMLRSRRTTAADELVSVLARARLCELLASPGDGAFAFTAGMISALDRFLAVPADELARTLPLDGELLAAAFGGVGPIGELIARVMRYETHGMGDTAAQPLAAAALDWAIQSAELLELR